MMRGKKNKASKNLQKEVSEWNDEESPSVKKQQHDSPNEAVLLAGLQSKNYKLAKELSEVRVRHREESKNVTRLTMENMNLASRCREAISQAAALKKELSHQKKKTVEAVGQTVAVIEQLKKMQQLQHQQQQQQQSNEKRRSQTDETSPTQSPTLTESSVESLHENTIDSIRTSNEHDGEDKQVNIHKQPFTSPREENGPLVESTTNVVAVQSMLAPKVEYVDEVSNQVEESKDVVVMESALAVATDKASPEKKGRTVADLIEPKKDEATPVAAEAIDPGCCTTKTLPLSAGFVEASAEVGDTKTAESSIPASEISTTWLAAVTSAVSPEYSKGMESSRNGLVSSDDYEDLTESPLEPLISSSPSNIAATTSQASVPMVDTLLKDVKATSTTDNVVATVVSGEVTAPKKYEEDIIKSPDSSKNLMAAKQLVNMDTILKIEDTWQEDYDESAETEDIITSLVDSPDRQGYFPDSSTPCTNRHHLPKVKAQQSPRSSGYNEEMPSDIIEQPAHRKAVGMHTVANFEKSIKEEDKSKYNQKYIRTSDLLSSIDAFEASFNTNFPESFSPKEDDSTAAFSPSNSVDKASAESSIYNPFDTETPSKEFTAQRPENNEKRGKWGLHRVRDRVAHLRNSSRSHSTVDKEETIAMPFPTMTTPIPPPIAPSESIVSISRSPDFYKESSAPLLIDSSDLSLSRLKLISTSSPPPPPPPPMSNSYKKIAPTTSPAASPSKIGHLDRFSTPVSMTGTPAVSGKTSYPHGTTFTRYNTDCIGQRSGGDSNITKNKSLNARLNNNNGSMAMNGTNSSSSASSATLSSSQRAVSRSKSDVNPPLREQAVLFSNFFSTNYSPSSWDEGDIPMRSNISPKKNDDETNTSQIDVVSKQQQRQLYFDNHFPDASIPANIAVASIQSAKLTTSTDTGYSTSASRSSTNLSADASRIASGNLRHSTSQLTSSRRRLEKDRTLTVDREV